MNNFNAIQLATFGETVEIQTPSPFTVKAIVEPDTQIEHLKQVQVNHQSRLVYIKEIDLKNKGVERHQKVERRGINYTIQEIGDDDNGFAVLRITRT